MQSCHVSLEEDMRVHGKETDRMAISEMKTELLDSRHHSPPKHWSSTDALAKAEVDEDLAKEEEQFERSAANLLGLSK